MLLVERLQGDYDATPAPMRKALTFAQGLVKHQGCGAFLHFLRELQKLMPPTEFEVAATNLRGQFQSGFMDPDLAHILETQFPPGDVGAVAAFRPGLDKLMKNFQIFIALNLKLD